MDERNAERISFSFSVSFPSFSSFLPPPLFRLSLQSEWRDFVTGDIRSDLGAFWREERELVLFLFLFVVFLLSFFTLLMMASFIAYLGGGERR